MHRFYSPIQSISQDKITLSDKEQVHHLRDVLRLGINDKIIIFDDKGNEYSAVIEKLLPQNVICAIKEKYRLIPAQKPKITIACAMPKKSKMDDIVDKLTQLGVERIIPLLTERVIIKLDREKELLRQERWEKIALSASQQSQRNTVPVIDSLKNIKEVLSESKDFDLKLIPVLTGQRKSLKWAYAQFKPKNILILIGPEGDFTPQEIDWAIKAGCIPVSLGNLVLRVETAAVVVAGFIRFLMDENG